MMGHEVEWQTQHRGIGHQYEEGSPDFDMLIFCVWRVWFI